MKLYLISYNKTADIVKYKFRPKDSRSRFVHIYAFINFNPSRIITTKLINPEQIKFSGLLFKWNHINKNL